MWFLNRVIDTTADGSKFIFFVRWTDFHWYVYKLKYTNKRYKKAKVGKK